MKKVRKLIELEIVKFKNIPDGGWNYYSRIFSKYEFISILVSKNFIIRSQKRFSCYPFSIVNNNCDLNNILLYGLINDQKVKIFLFNTFIYNEDKLSRKRLTKKHILSSLIRSDYIFWIKPSLKEKDYIDYTRKITIDINHLY